MATTVNRAGFWDDQVWGSIDDGVKQAVGAIRVVQKVFPTVQVAKATSVPADIFNPEKMSIAEGHTRPFIELVVEFPLTNGQVNDDPTGATAITLSKLAARSLAVGASNGPSQKEASHESRMRQTELEPRHLEADRQGGEQRQPPILVTVESKYSGGPNLFSIRTKFVTSKVEVNHSRSIVTK